jgi:hypothetical protein
MDGTQQKAMRRGGRTTGNDGQVVVPAGGGPGLVVLDTIDEMRWSGGGGVGGILLVPCLDADLGAAELEPYALNVYCSNSF